MTDLLLPLIVFLPLIAAFLPVFMKDGSKSRAVVVLTGIAELRMSLVLIFTMQPGVAASLDWFAGFGVFFQTSSLGNIMCVLAGMLRIICGLMSANTIKQDGSKRFYSCLLAAFGGALGVFLSRELSTMFVFFEIMAYSLYVLIAHNQDREAEKAGKSYLAYAVISGLVMLMGIFLLDTAAGTLEISQLKDACAYAENQTAVFAGVFMTFIGFASVVGIFPFHGWVAKAYKCSPTPVTVFVSGVVSASGIYGIIILTLKAMAHSGRWAPVLLVLSELTVVLGCVYALVCADLMYSMAFLSVSRSGLAGFGTAFSALAGNDFATLAGRNANTVFGGTVCVIISRIMAKTVLLAYSKAAVSAAGTSELNGLQGRGRKDGFAKVSFLTAAFALIGIPAFSGYIGNTLLINGMGEYISAAGESAGVLRTAEALLIICTAVTAACLAKLYICLFTGKKGDSGAAKSGIISVSSAVKFMLGLLCAAMVICGVLPYATFDKICIYTARFMESVPAGQTAYFGFEALKYAVIAIAAGAVIYVGLVRNVLVQKKNGYKNLYNDSLTIDNKVYSPLIFGFLPFVGALFARVLDVAADVFIFVVNRLFCKSVPVPDTFWNGKPVSEADLARRSSKVSVTGSLAYSLMLFGLGLVIILIYLLVAEFRI